MNNLKLISNYKDITEYRLSFNQLANSTFGIDFENWYQKGFWNDRYICYSYVDGNRVVANVSISKMDIILEGQRKSALQIGTVMTHPDYRNQGLSASLMNTVLEENEKNCDFIYLFANKTVLNFYPKFGFKTLRESYFSLPVSVNKSNCANVRKLDTLNINDLNIITKLASERVPLSNTFAVENAQYIFMWYCFNIFNEDIYYLEDEDVIVIFKHAEDKLHIFDIISRNEVCFNNILNSIAHNETKEVVFYFTPQFKDVTPNCVLAELDEDDTLFVRPSINITKNFKYPMTAHT